MEKAVREARAAPPRVEREATAVERVERDPREVTHTHMDTAVEKVERDPRAAREAKSQVVVIR